MLRKLNPGRWQRASLAVFLAREEAEGDLPRLLVCERRLPVRQVRLQRGSALSWTLLPTAGSNLPELATVVDLARHQESESSLKLGSHLGVVCFLLGQQ